MTRSQAFAQVIGSPLLRGVDTEYVRELFERKLLDSPMLLLRRSEIRRNFTSLDRALPRAELHYAVKSNNHQVFFEEIHRLGGKFEVCSAREIDQALRAGVPASTLVHTHPIKSTREFDYAVAAGIGIFVVDNIDEIRKLERYQDRRLKIMIRYRINNNTKAVVDLQYKFGCVADDVPELAAEVRKRNHDVHGLCFHIGSQCVYAENYVRAIEMGAELIRSLNENGHRIRLLDIGGGFPVEYVEPAPSIETLCAPINEALDRHIPADIRVICEPGRFISASPVTLICTVVGKAHRDGKIWYYLDDGLYSTFSGILFDHCQYPVITEQVGEERLSVLAGPTCDSFDVMYDGLMIPEHKIGDMMMFPLTGAYCAVSGSDFNSLKRADYVLID